MSSASLTTPDPFKRKTTRYKGITYRVKADGSRSYFAYSGGRQHLVSGGEKEALRLQAELRAKPPTVAPPSIRFRDLAEDWYEVKSPRLRKRTADYYRSALDLVLLPRFGSLRIAAIDADAISRLVRDLEREGLHAVNRSRPVRPLGRSSIENYLKPLQGVLSLAVRRRLIGTDPFDHLTQDDRPKREEKAPVHEWTDEEVGALIAASEAVARKPESRYDYSPIIKLVVCLGLRLGEVLGLQWQDFDKGVGTLHVRRQWLRSGEYGPTKTPAGVRRIALPAGVRDDLIAFRLRSKSSQEEHPIFASREGTPLGHRNVTRRGFEPAAKEAGLDVTFHDLRHAAASRMIDAGLDPVTVAAVLGHEDANVTLKVYAHRFGAQRKDDAVRLALAGAVG